MKKRKHDFSLSFSNVDIPDCLIEFEIKDGKITKDKTQGDLNSILSFLELKISKIAAMEELPINSEIYSIKEAYKDYRELYPFSNSKADEIINIILGFIGGIKDE